MQASLSPVFFWSCLTFGIGFDGREFQRITGLEVGIGFGEGLVVDDAMNAVPRAHDEVIIAFGANEEIILERLVENDGLAAGTFGPKSFGDTFPSQSFCNE